MFKRDDRMRVLLVRMNSISDELIPPISLGYLAAAVRQRHDVQILDALKDSLNEAAVAETVQGGGYDVVGFQAWTRDLPAVREVCTLIRRQSPQIVTVVGGAHASVRPLQTMSWLGNALDYAWQGEAENGFSDFLDALAQGGPLEMLATIPGLVWRYKGEIVANPVAVVEDLDRIGMPAWDLMPPDSYPEAPHGAFYRNFPIAPIVVTRGCPFPCTFCSASKISGRKVRSRSVGSVLRELTFLKERYGVKEFHIEDDNFTHSKSWVLEFCTALEASSLGMSWSFPNGIRLDTLDFEMLERMRQAGCYALNFGIESGSSQILKRIRKGITTEMIRSRVELAKSVGYCLGGFFIIGFPGETVPDIEQTITFACSLPLDRIGLSYFQPFPGTSLHDELLSTGEINDEWSEQKLPDLHNLTYVSTTLTEDQLRKFRRKFFLSFYLRPAVMRGLFNEIKSTSHLLFMLKRALRWYRS